MPTVVEIEHPEANSVTLSERFLAEGHGRVRVTGTGNQLRIEEPLIAGGSTVVLTGGASVAVEAGCNLGRLEIHALAPGAVVAVGARCSFNAFSQITAHEPARVTIGADCLFGHDCNLAASDVHQILDARTGARLNPASDILIGDHVWLGPRVAVLRGSAIGRDSVVGLGSVVKGSFPPNCVLAGAPARVINRGITWRM